MTTNNTTRMGTNMSNGEMLPRITVTDDDDRHMVIAALMHHMHRTAASALLSGDVNGLVDDTRIIGRLLDELATEATVPDDAELAEHVERLRREFGQDGNGI